MNSTHQLLAAAVAGWLAFPVLVHSQDDSGKWYLRVDAGATQVMKVDVDEFPVPSPDGTMRFDPGVRLGFAGGYQILPWLAAEIETGMLASGVHRLNGRSIDAALIQVPLMANVVVQCNHFGRFVPFVGGGAGGVTSVFAVDQRFMVGNELLWLEGADSDLVVAYQGFAGLRYEFRPRMALGLTYRFLGTGAPSWDVENRLRGEDMRIKFDEVFTHAVTVQFNLGF